MELLQVLSFALLDNLSSLYIHSIVTISFCHPVTNFWPVEIVMTYLLEIRI